MFIFFSRRTLIQYDNYGRTAISKYNEPDYQVAFATIIHNYGAEVECKCNVLSINDQRVVTCSDAFVC